MDRRIVVYIFAQILNGFEIIFNVKNFYIQDCIRIYRQHLCPFEREFFSSAPLGRTRVFFGLLLLLLGFFTFEVSMQISLRDLSLHQLDLLAKIIHFIN